MFFANMGGVLAGGGRAPQGRRNFFCIQDPPRHDIEGGEGGGLGPMSNDMWDPLKRQSKQPKPTNTASHQTDKNIKSGSNAQLSRAVPNN